MKFSELKIPNCRNFSGYKPCISFKNCLLYGCQNKKEFGTKILIISLDALGNVLQNTSILKALKAKYPTSTIYWITKENAQDILLGNNYVDYLYRWNDEDRMILQSINFDLLLNADKSIYACSFANIVKAKLKFGFLLNENGQIIPASDSALYNYLMGIDDELKFRENTKTGSQILHETFELEYKRDEYVYNFNDQEIDFMERYKEKNNYDPSKTYIGFNTGCSNLFPNKKMTIEQHVSLINELVKYKYLKIVLLGGKEDTERNLKIYESLSKDVQRNILYTPTNMGLRFGACFMNICDVVITGDSFGMHLAIALKKYVIAWFGLSCWNEIDLFDKGEKIIPEGLECAPCWNKVCPNKLECIDLIDLKKIKDLVIKYSLVKPFLNMTNN